MRYKNLDFTLPLSGFLMRMTIKQIQEDEAETKMIIITINEIVIPTN